MKVKKFTAPTMQDALRIIRHDLGPDAIILTTEKVKGDDGKVTLEITAAVDRTNHAAPAPSPQKAAERPPVYEPDWAIPASEKPLRENASQSLSLKTIFEKHGLDTEIAHRITGAVDALHATGFSAEDTLDMVLSKMVPFAAPAEAFPSGKVHIFIGPAGGGKTTTLCKIAVEKRLQKRSLELFTLDNTKIGAFEQIDTFARAINQEAFMLQTEADWQSHAARAANADFTFMDTPGVSPFNREKMKALQQRIQRLELDAMVHLVLPTSLNASELVMLPAAYHLLKPQTLIFTKLDETIHYGGLINVAVTSGLKVCYMTDGPSIPNDLCALDAASLAHKLARAPRYPWEETE